MGRLYPTLPVGAGESPQSFVSRLARLNGIASARFFCTDLGLPFQGIVDGDASALAELADLAGASLDTLINNALRREGDSWRIRGERILKGSLRRARNFVCPACLAEDAATADVPRNAAVYGRSIWLINHIRTCIQHSVGLIETPPGKSSQAHDFAILVGRHAASLIREVENAARREPSALERYLIARLEGSTTDKYPWLNALEFCVVARTCEIIGAVSQRGRRPKFVKMTESDWRSAGETGFNIASNGASAVRAFLSDLQRTLPHGRANVGPQAEFGTLHQWLSFGARHPSYDPVRDLMRRHIIETTPVGPGDIVMGKPVEKRVLHSVFTASIELKLHPKRLRKLLAAMHFIQPGHEKHPDDQVLFDAEHAQTIRDSGVTDALPLRDIRAYLNAGRVHAKLLADSKIIPPVKGTEADGINAQYAKADLDDFLEKLLADTVPVSTANKDQCLISKAAKRANCSAMEIVRLILDRKLAWVGRQEGVVGYLSMLVDYHEIRRLTRGEALNGLTAEMIEYEMRTSGPVVKALIKSGHLPTQTVVNPLNRCPVAIVPHADYAAFRREYATLFELAREIGIHHRALNSELAGQGIQPAFDKKAIGATFYKRADVEKVQIKPAEQVSKTHQQQKPDSMQ